MDVPDLVVITWNVSDIAQAETSGTVKFQLSKPVTDTSTGNVITPDPPRTYSFADADQSDPIIANDSPSLDPQDSQYTITITAADGTAYNWTTPIHYANGAEQKLGDLVAGVTPS